MATGLPLTVLTTHRWQVGASSNRATAGRNGNGTRSSSWAELEERVPSGKVRCGRCGWLIELGDDWRSSDDYGPEHLECRGTPPVPRRSRRRTSRGSGHTTGGESPGERR